MTLVLVSVLVGVVFAGLAGLAIIGFHGPKVNSTISSIGQIQPTATPRATSTPGPTYSAPVPACGVNASDWNAAASAVTHCSAAGLMITSPASANTIAEVFLNLTSFASSYSLKVHVAALTHGCAGMAVLRDQYKGYDGYVCADGTWKIVRYDSTGHGSNVAQGKLAATKPAYDLLFALAGRNLALRINNVPISHVTVDATYTVTQAVSLTLDHFTNVSASAVYSTFSLTQ